jgi:hypothetical protein
MIGEKMGRTMGTATVQRAGRARRWLALASALAAGGIPHPAAASSPSDDPTGGSSPVFSKGEPPCTLLDLEGDAPDSAQRLGAALGRALARRELDDGRSATQAELRLAMGCDGEAPACLARGGRSLGAQRMLYGVLRSEGGGYTLTLDVLDVASATVIRSSQTPLLATAIVEDTIDQTADTLIAALFPASRRAEDIAAPSVAAPSVAGRTEPTRSDVGIAPRPRKREWWFGRERPTPTWQWAALGTSIAVTGVMLATFIGTTVTTKVSLRRKLLAAVDESQHDENPSNDISRAEQDLCAAARATPPGETNPGRVTNSKVTRICNHADGVQKLQIASAIVMSIGLVATAAFTTVMLVHRGKRPPQRRRIALALDGAPGRVQLGLSGRF